MRAGSSNESGNVNSHRFSWKFRFKLKDTDPQYSWLPTDSKIVHFHLLLWAELNKRINFDLWQRSLVSTVDISDDDDDAKDSSRSGACTVLCLFVLFCFIVSFHLKCQRSLTSKLSEKRNVPCEGV